MTFRGEGRGGETGAVAGRGWELRREFPSDAGIETSAVIASGATGDEHGSAVDTKARGALPRTLTRDDRAMMRWGVTVEKLLA